MSLSVGSPDRACRDSRGRLGCGPGATPAGHVLLPTHREVMAAASPDVRSRVVSSPSAPVRLAACLHSTPPQ